MCVVERTLTKNREGNSSDDAVMYRFKMIRATGDVWPDKKFLLKYHGVITKVGLIPELQYFWDTFFCLTAQKLCRYLKGQSYLRWTKESI